MPDFPLEKAEKLWSILPKGSRSLAAAIYLLPFDEESIGETERNHARVLTLLTLSAFTHGDLEKNRAFSDGEAVLYGDYLFALAFSLIPEEIHHEDAERLLERSYRFGENRLRHLTIPKEAEEFIAYAQADYGSLLKDIAEEAANRCAMEDTKKERYILCAEALGTAWGIRCENYPVSSAPLWEKSKEFAKGLPMEKSLTHIIKELEGATGENHS